MPGTTPIYGLRYQELGDAPDGAGLGQYLGEDVEAELERVDQELADHEARLVVLEDVKGRCAMAPAAAQSLPNATFTQMVFDTVEFDTAGMADVVGNRIVVPHDGFYRITYKASFDSSGVGRRIATVEVNGVEVERIEGAPATFYLATLTHDRELLAGDVVTVEQYHNSGGALTTYNSSKPRLSVVEL